MSSARVRNCPTMTMTTHPGEDADGDPIPTPRTRRRNGSTGSRSWPRSAFCQILMFVNGGDKVGRVGGRLLTNGD